MKIGVQVNVQICTSNCKYKTKIRDLLAGAWNGSLPGWAV